MVCKTLFRLTRRSDGCSESFEGRTRDILQGWTLIDSLEIRVTPLPLPLGRGMSSRSQSGWYKPTLGEKSAKSNADNIILAKGRGTKVSATGDGAIEQLTLN